MVAILFILKLPILAFSVVLLARLGGPAIGGFLAGIVLVYSALVWRVQSASGR